MSVTHVRANIDANGVEFSWIRRTRVGGDNWEQFEVPLGEDVERYEVDILDMSGHVKRTLSTGAPSVSYSSAQILADFGDVPVSFSLAVYQMSASHGRGSMKLAHLTT